MGAFYTLALALAPRLAHYLVRNGDDRRHGETRPIPAAEIAGPRQSRHIALACHWERADDGSLVAHWMKDDGEAADEPPRIRDGSLFHGLPPKLVDAAYDFDRQGSVQALIAISRMARMHQSEPLRCFKARPIRNLPT